MGKHGCAASTYLVLVVFGMMNITAESKPIKSNPTQTLSDRIDHIRGSVVRVTVRFEDGQTSSGSGFVVNKDGNVVTANHVVNPLGKTIAEVKRASILVEQPVPATTLPSVTITSSFVSAIAKIVATDSAHDIAILAAPDIMTDIRGVRKDIATKVVPARLVDFTIRDGEPVFVSGYPLEMPVLITNSGFVASSAPITTDPVDRSLLDTYWLDIQANHGNSGGPVFSLQTGYVIAIQVGVVLTAVEYLDPPNEKVVLQVTDPQGKVASKMIGYNAGIAKVVPAKYIENLLIKNGILF